MRTNHSASLVNQLRLSAKRMELDRESLCGRCCGWQLRISVRWISLRKLRSQMTEAGRTCLYVCEIEFCVVWCKCEWFNISKINVRSTLTTRGKKLVQVYVVKCVCGQFIICETQQFSIAFHRGLSFEVVPQCGQVCNRSQCEMKIKMFSQNTKTGRKLLIFSFSESQFDNVFHNGLDKDIRGVRNRKNAI